MIKTLSQTNVVYDTIMRDLKDGKVSFPRIPSHVVRIDKLIRDEDKSIKDLSRLIECEPSLAIRILQVANSSFYGSISKVNSIQQAVSRLGMTATRNVVIALAIRDVFRSPDMFINSHLNALWERSIDVASLSVILARRVKLDVDVAIISGMLHDIGTLAVVGYWFNHGVKSVENKEDLMNKVAPFLSCPLGHAVLTAWNFPDDLIDVVSKQCDHNDVHVSEVQPIDLVITAKAYINVVADKISTDEFNNIKSVVKMKITYDDVMEMMEDFAEIRKEFFQTF